MAFSHRPGDPVGSTTLSPVKDYDEVAAKRLESGLVDLGGHFTESLLCIQGLEHELTAPNCRALLLRIKQRIHDDEADLARLMCEAQKEVRGE